MKLKPFNLPVLKAAKPSTMLPGLQCCAVNLGQCFRWLLSCVLSLSPGKSSSAAGKEREEWFWSSWFDRLENEPDIEAGHKIKTAEHELMILLSSFLV